MPLILLALVLLMPLVVLLLLPLTLVQRYRIGTTRRRARLWLLSLNLVVALFSAAVLLIVTTVMTVWVPGAFTGVVAGLAGGAALGVVGLAASRWEMSGPELHYTPNRWLVLGITLVVAGRLLYGVWRGWQAWAASAGDAPWLETAGVPGSVAAAGLVIAYTATYAFGVRRRLLRGLRDSAPLTIDHPPVTRTR